MSDPGKASTQGPIPGYVVAQFFGFFNGIRAEHYARIVDTAPFDACNLLILAFVRTGMSKQDYIAQFTNKRDGQFPRRRVTRTRIA